VPTVEEVTMFRTVQRRVRAAIKQAPHLSFNALGDVYFCGPPGPANVVASAGPAMDEAAWNIVKDTTDAASLRRFLSSPGPPLLG
jgi:hypothetical protein